MTTATARRLGSPPAPTAQVAAVVMLALLGCAGAASGGTEMTEVEGPSADLVAASIDIGLDWYHDATGFAGTAPAVTWAAPGMTNADGLIVAGETAGPDAVIVVHRPDRSIAMSALTHELLHALEWQRTGDPDHDHEGPLWSEVPAVNCQVMSIDAVCDGGALPPTCPLCGR